MIWPLRSKQDYGVSQKKLYLASCPNIRQGLLQVLYYLPRSKTPRHKPYGNLRQLPIAEKPWNSMSIDFIEHLPLSSGYTSILVVVDRLTKQAIFIPTHDTITSQELAQLFVIHVFSKHGIPSPVTSDRSVEFVSHFFRSLGKALNMKLHFTSSYHPKGDGQTEHTNQTLEHSLVPIRYGAILLSLFFEW